MSNNQHSGSAFPAGYINKSRPSHDPGGDFRITAISEPAQAGMTLRDYFAARAMEALLKYYCEMDDKIMYSLPKDWKQLLAYESYDIADTMLMVKKSNQEKENE